MRKGRQRKIVSNRRAQDEKEEATDASYVSTGTTSTFYHTSKGLPTISDSF
jgi:hypothetical protein